MLLKLIPLLSQPTIHFSLTLPTFPSHLDPPQSYTAQINHLLVEDLEIPNTLHSLDKSVGLMSLLEEVLFEIKHGTGDGGGGATEKTVHVTCRFVDGAVEEWLSNHTGLISALDSIVKNVQESTLEDDRERERYLQSQMQNNRSRVLNRLSMSSAPSSSLTMTGSKPRHKKQRSLFMQIVSSIVNLTSTSSSSSSHLPTFVDPSQPESFYSPPQSPTSDTAALRPPSSKRARLLRRTARSNLVNTYRRHVLPELTHRFPREGGFGVWILHSMRRRALERMEDLIQEAAVLQRQHVQQQHILELRQRHEHDEREQEQQYRYQQERARSPIRVDEQPSGLRFSFEEAGFSATTMTVPLSFSDEGGSTENENDSTNASRNGTRNSEEVEDDLETITDDSSVHTPSLTSHIGTGFMGGNCPTPPADSTTSSPPSTPTQPLPTPSRSLPPNPQPSLPPHFDFEYTQLSRLRQRLHSLILFADSQARIGEDEKRNREEILLIRGRRRAWLNAELGVGKGVWQRGDSGVATGMGQMQWGFAAPFKSSPLARHSWSASAESTDDTSGCLPDSQRQLVDEEDDEFPYDEFNGPPVVHNHHTLSYVHGRQSRRSRRYMNGRGSGKKLLPVTEEFEYEYDQNSINGTGEGVINVQFYHPPGLGHPDDSFHHRDDAFLHHQQDGDVDSLSDNFSLEDPRELDLELGFGLQDPGSFVGEDGQESFDNQREREPRRSGESIRIAFEMERPNIIPRVRDSSSDDSMSISSSSSTSTRSGGLLSWGIWGVGKNNSESGSGDGTIRRRRSWKNGIGIGIGLSRGRSLSKTCQRRGSEEEDEQCFSRLRSRISMSSMSSTSSSSSTKSQPQQHQQHQHQHQREPAQGEPEPERPQNDGQELQTTPLLCQPVSFSVSHASAPAVIAALPLPATPSTTTALANLPPDDINTPPDDVTPPPDDATTPLDNATTPPDDAITPPKGTEMSKDVNPATTITSTSTPSLTFTTKKLCVASPAPNVYADLDVSVVHVGDDDKSMSLGFAGNQSTFKPGANHMRAQAQAQVQSGLPGQAPPRLRPRRHKREYQYQHQRPLHHTYENDAYYGQDECDEYEFSGYGEFGGTYHQRHHQHRHNSMIHARRHLDELLLEEGLYGCDAVSMGGDQEEFTLAMDVPAVGSGRGGNVTGRKKLRKMQYLHLHHNRDSSQQSRLQLQQLHHDHQGQSMFFPPNSLSASRDSPRGSVAC